MTKRTIRRESWLSRLGLGVVAAVEYFVMNWIAEHFGVAHRRFVPDSDTFLWLGLVMTIAGLSFAIWARATIGSNWSGTVTIKQDHELIRRGPYALARHPIYTGVIFAVLGSAIFLGEISSLIFIAVMLSALLQKIRVEERFMTQQFGSAYTDYQNTTKALVPFLW